ncbi:MAG: endolytic transglycosylase MltG [Holosporales bacterium]|jgi:UPF0755 protein|nr:endolytic transglycosylase MltG [Holosporales bacterium]
MALFQESTRETHNIFFTNGNNLYETIKEDGSFGNGAVFFLLEKIPALNRRIYTGEYVINRHETVYSFISRMFQGDTVIRKITIPEGYTVQMIVEKLNNEDSLKGVIENISEEGSLFPSTYFYKKNDSKNSIIQKMKGEMEKVIRELFSKKTKEYIRDTIIMASIIEKETKTAKERPFVASVFKNRIKKNMRLQSDPTVIYALSNGYGKIDHPLTRNELLFNSPYNTYRNKGLPPSPICCPSKESIISALNPANTDYLYFVAENDDSHIFSSDYKIHVKNIQGIKKRKNR